MKRTRRPLAITAGVITLFFIYIQSTYRQKMDAPPISILADSNSGMIAPGKTGAFVSAPFPNGYTSEMPEVASVSSTFRPVDSTSPMYDWSEKVFIEQFKVGRVLNGSSTFGVEDQTLTNDDMKALHQFLAVLTAMKSELTEAFISYHDRQQLRTGDGGRSRSGAR